MHVCVLENLENKRALTKHVLTSGDARYDVASICFLLKCCLMKNLFDDLELSLMSIKALQTSW